MSAEQPANALTAIASYLRDQIGALCEDRVYRPKLPDADVPSMPRACIVIKAAGGYTMTGGSMLPLADPRLDILAYGATPLEAGQLALAALVALRALRPHVRESVPLKWARISGGLLPLEDPDDNWPAYVFSTQVLHGETAVN